MKKIYIGILAVVYMAVSSGIAVQLHYCMGDRAGMELFGSSTDTCGKCGMTEKDTGCCHDEFKFYKINDSHKTASNNIDLTAPVFAVVQSHDAYHFLVTGITAVTSFNNHSPPDYTKPPARIMNGVFRI